MAFADEQTSHESSPPATAADAAPATALEPAPTTQDEAEAETPKIAHDSMVTVRLSEPPALTLDTSVADDESKPTSPEPVPSRDSASNAGTDHAAESDTEKRASTVSVVASDANRSLQDELAEGAGDADSGNSSDDQDEVNWEKLQKTEDEQTKDEETDNVGCHLGSLLRHQRHARYANQ